MCVRKTIFYPLGHENPYVNIVTDCISEAGYELHDLSEIKGNRQLAKEIKIINLNWFDSIGGKSLLKALALLVRQILRVQYYKYCGMKIIYTMHNRRAHDTKYPRINHFLMKYLCKKADRIAVLCNYSGEVLKEYLPDEMISRKMRVMYHPCYQGIYSLDVIPIAELQYDRSTMHVLFIGAIRPYKNIELIIKLAEKFQEKNILFTIAGKPLSEDYWDKIQRQANNLKNVTFIPRFIDDNEIVSLYHWCDIVTMPLSIKSSLNSGSCMLAFSMGKTVVAPLIGTLRDLPVENMFAYEYDSEEDHFDVLAEQLGMAYHTWLSDRNRLSQMGTQMKNYVSQNFSRSKTIERYKTMYDELI